MYYLPSSSSGKPHVVALDKKVGAHLECVLFSIIVIIMVMIRRSRRMHDYSDYYGDDQEEEKEDAWGSTQSGPVQSNRDQPLSLPVF